MTTLTNLVARWAYRGAHRLPRHRPGRHRVVLGAGALVAAQRYMVDLGDGWRLACAA